MMKNWKDMDKFEKVDAIRSVHYEGCAAADIAKLIPGASRAAIIATYYRNKADLADAPLRTHGKGKGSGGKCEIKITEDQMPQIVALRDEGKTMEAISEIMGVGASSIRRAFVRYDKPFNPNKDKTPVSAGHVTERRDTWKSRVSDGLDHPMARLIHEGPSPERRKLMEEGRI